MHIKELGLKKLNIPSGELRFCFNGERHCSKCFSYIFCVFVFQGDIGMKDVGTGAANVDDDGKRDFSNPMYEAMGGTDFGVSNASSRSSTMSPSSDAGNDYVVGGPAGRHAFENFDQPAAAILAPSSVTHKSSPQLAARHKEVSPAVDTGKDTQCLVEEDDSDC